MAQRINGNFRSDSRIYLLLGGHGKGNPIQFGFILWEIIRIKRELEAGKLRESIDIENWRKSKLVKTTELAFKGYKRRKLKFSPKDQRKFDVNKDSYTCGFLRLQLWYFFQRFSRQFVGLFWSRALWAKITQFLTSTLKSNESKKQWKNFRSSVRQFSFQQIFSNWSEPEPYRWGDIQLVYPSCRQSQMFSAHLCLLQASL